MKIFIFYLTAITFSTSAISLEIDEKLTTRMIEVSSTKKTVLLNRGLEDGLTVGDHAKIFLTSGVIARAVVIKASPGRSIWSIYRLISPEQVVVDKVVNLKITAPLDITNDPSRTLYPPKSNSDVNALESLAELNSEEKKDYYSLNDSPPFNNIDGIPKDRTFETWGMIHLNNFSGSTNNNIKSTLSGLNLSLGVEKYFKPRRKNIFKNISFSLFYHHSQSLATSINGNSSGNLAHEFGGGISWHFLAPALSYYRPIAFLQGTYGIGRVEDSVQIYDAERTVLKGIDNFFSLGLGLKYYTLKGWGGRMLADFYYRNEHYTIENSTQRESKQLRGIRFMLGIAWRFQ